MQDDTKNIFSLSRIQEIIFLIKKEIINIIDKESLLFIEALVVLIVMLVFASIISYVMVFFLKTIQKKQKNYILDSIISASFSPIVTYIIIKFFVMGVSIINKGFHYSVIDITKKGLEKIDDVNDIFNFTWFLIALLEDLKRKLFKIKFANNPGVHPLIRLIVLVIESIFAAIALINTFISFGFNVRAALTFGGAGSVIIGFASKDLMANFLSAVLIHIDRPYILGDDIFIPSNNIAGTIEKISWRLTVIRQYNKTPIYITNSTLASLYIENRSRRTHRLIDEKIRIRYTKSNNIKDILYSIRNIIFLDQAVDATQAPMICITGIGKNIFEIRIYCLIHSVNFNEMYETLQGFIMNINKILREVHKTHMVFLSANVQVSDEVYSYKIVENDEEVSLIEVS